MAGSMLGTVLVVDDHPPIRNSIRRALRREWDVFPAATALAARQAASAEIPAAIVDLGLPDDDGFTLIATLTERGIKVVVYSASDGPASVARAAEAGALGFLGKLRHETELVLALRAVIQGERYFPDDYAVPAASGVGSIECLTPSEQRILFLIGDGLSTKAIALKLGRSPRTVEGHRLAMAKKLKLRSPIDLVSFALTFRRKPPPT